MDTINAKEFDLKTILSNKYTVDYFQREYKWERKNIEELIDDIDAGERCGATAKNRFFWYNVRRP